MSGGGREVYFEHRAIGSVVKVSAICSVTGVEVSVVGPINASQRDLETLALRKLEARLAAAATPPARPPEPPHGGGGRFA